MMTDKSQRFLFQIPSEETLGNLSEKELDIVYEQWKNHMSLLIEELRHCEDVLHLCEMLSKTHFN